MSTQPPLAVCVSSWFVRNAVAALHRSWCSVFIPALQLNKWGPIRCFSPWVLLSAFNMPHTFYHCRKPSNVSVNFWKWLYSNSDVKVFRKRKYIFESVYWTPHQTHSSVFCSITYSWLFFFFLRGLTSSGVNVTVSPPSTVDFLCFGISLSAEEGSGSARPILDFIPCSSLNYK